MTRSTSGATALLRSRFQGHVEGRAVDLYTLRNRQGMAVSVSNLGARIQQVVTPDRDGQWADTVLGYDSLEGVLQDTSWLGAFVGRYANRIGGARLSLDGHEYALQRNDGANTLHGGALGSSARAFDVVRSGEDQLVLAYRFHPQDDGFPGRVDLELSYTVDPDNALVVEWTAQALDVPTVTSFTSHAYFNLSGVPGSTALDHAVCIHADRMLEVGAGQIPTGRVLPVQGTVFDLRQLQALAQSPTGGAYDHFWVADSSPVRDGLRLQATVRHAASGRTLETWSTEPGLQFYTGGWLGNGNTPDSMRDKNGHLLVRNGGLCLEPSCYPDAPNHPHFPDAGLRPGVVRTGKIVYRFGVMPG